MWSGSPSTSDNSTVVVPGRTTLLPHRIRIECEETALGQMKAWADFISWRYDIFRSRPHRSPSEQDDGAARTYTGYKLFSDSNEGLYLTFVDMQTFYQQIRNATEVVITSHGKLPVQDRQGGVHRDRGIERRQHCSPCWSQSSVPAASPGGEESIRLDTPFRDQARCAGCRGVHDLALISKLCSRHTQRGTVPSHRSHKILLTWFYGQPSPDAAGLTLPPVYPLTIGRLGTKLCHYLHPGPELVATVSTGPRPDRRQNGRVVRKLCHRPHPLAHLLLFTKTRI